MGVDIKLKHWGMEIPVHTKAQAVDLVHLLKSICEVTVEAVFQPTTEEYSVTVHVRLPDTWIKKVDQGVQIEISDPDDSEI